MRSNKGYTLTVNGKNIAEFIEWGLAVKTYEASRMVAWLTNGEADLWSNETGEVLKSTSDEYRPF